MVSCFVSIAFGMLLIVSFGDRNEVNASKWVLNQCDHCLPILKLLSNLSLKVSGLKEENGDSSHMKKPLCLKCNTEEATIRPQRLLLVLSGFVERAECIVITSEKWGSPFYSVY